MVKLCQVYYLSFLVFVKVTFCLCRKPFNAEDTARGKRKGKLLYIVLFSERTSFCNNVDDLSDGRKNWEKMRNLKLYKTIVKVVKYVPKNEKEYITTRLPSVVPLLPIASVASASPWRNC